MFPENIEIARVPVALEPSADERWRRWREESRHVDARFHRRVRIVMLDAAAIIALGLAAWFAF